MNKTKFTSFQFACLVCFPILSLFSGIGTYNVIRIARVDAYMSPIIAGILGIIVLKLFMYIFDYLPDKNLPAKNKVLFGKFLGTIVNYIICLLFLMIGVVLIYNVSNFAISQFLSETPLIIFMILLGIVLIYNVSLGIENISRVGILFFGIICLFTIISSLGILPTVEMGNIKPMLEYGVEKPLIGGIFLFVVNIVPIFALLIVEKDMLIDNKKTSKYLGIFYFIAILFVFMAVFFTISSLGIYLSLEYQYAEYTVLKKISMLNFIDRIENFIYIKWILSSVMFLSIILYYISNSINKNSKKLVPTIILGIVIYVSLYLFKNNTVFYNFTSDIFPYICLGLFLIVIIICINIFIRKLFKIDIKNETISEDEKVENTTY